MLPLRHVFLALFVMAIWGFNFVVIKVGVGEVPPLLLTGLRFLAAAIPAIFFVKRPSAAWRFVIAYGVVLGVVKFGLLFVAIKWGLTAGLASLVLQLQAFFTIGFAVLLLHERPKPAQIYGACLAFFGIAIIASGRWTALDLLPLALCVAAACAWGMANIISKKSGETNMLGFVVWSSAVSPIPLFLLSWALEDHDQIIRVLTMPSALAIGSILFLAWISTLLGFSIWNDLMARYGAGTIAPFSLLVPVFGIMSGILVLHESLTILSMVGGFCVVLGLIVNVFGAKFALKWRSKTPVLNEK